MSAIEQLGKELQNLTKNIPHFGLNSLKDLIKSIRSCKTQQDERAVIQKESATIRTAFKEENNTTRYINIEKLLYIYMLGYPAHFGQIECLKLAASPKFSDKRLAYLGTTLLLDENQATLTLVTNCLKNDMNNSNVYIVGLALCTLGNIASPEMGRDLSSEVERLLSSNNSYVRKKACLTALRIVRKVPDLADHFLERATSLLSERNHGVLLTGITLLEQMCSDSESVTEGLRSQVPLLCRHLKSLVAGGSSPEHDIHGVTDPFLQVKLLRLLRILGDGSNSASEQMNDVLAQVATATDASKNVGNAILYEAVLTIMNIESDSSLRVLGINILGRFLQNKDSNIKYVALTTLTTTSQVSTATDASALQRHRSTVIDCLRDPDISIRRRALDLSFYLISPQNIRILTRELLSYLELVDKDSKPSVALRICDHAGRFRPSKRWEIDTIIRVLRVAGQYVDQAVINHFVKLVTTGDRIVHLYSVQKLYQLVEPLVDITLIQEGLLQAALWTIGEYGDILISSQATGMGADEDDEEQVPFQTPSEAKAIELVETILKGPYATSLVKEYGVTCLIKLGSRFTGDNVLAKIRQIIGCYRVNIDVEIQQRALEYHKIFSLDASTRSALLETMPVLESAVSEEAIKGTGVAPAAEKQPRRKPAAPMETDLIGVGEQDVLSAVFGAGSSTKPKGGDDLMDLLGGLDMNGSSASVMSARPSAVTPAAASNTVDLLGDLFGDSSPATTTPAVASPSSNVFPNVSCYSKNGLSISLTPMKESSTITQLKATFTCNSGEMQGLNFQVAVPKSLRLAMQPASGTSVSPSKPVTQLLKIENLTKVPIRLRIKLSYIAPGIGKMDDIVECSSFDSELWT